MSLRHTLRPCIGLPRLLSPSRIPNLRPFLRSLSTLPTPSAPLPSLSLPPPPPPKTILDHLPKWAEKAKPYLLLTRFDKPIGWVLLYWPCAWGITIASTITHQPITTPLFYLGLFGVGAIVMRGAGCTINDMWDRRIDAAVERTKNRPLARGDLTQFQALSFLGLQLSVGLGILTQLNWYSIGLGASSLSLVVLYPFMKRITYFPQIVLGLAFNWGTLLGYSAIAGSVDWVTMLPLYVGGVGWTVFYDTIYAHQDKADDILISVKSTALLFASQTRPILAALGTSWIATLTYVGHLTGASPIYYAVSVAGAAAHMIWQLVNVDFEKRESCWRFFVANGWMGGLIWLGMWGDYLGRVVFDWF